MAEEDKYKKRMISCFRFPEEGLSLREWGRIRNPVRVLRNFLIISMCKYMPDIALKNMLYRKTGIKIGKNVRIYGTNFDIFFPEMIEIGDNCTIGSFTTIVTHEFHHNQYRKGRVKIGSNVLVGSLTMILAGVEIGDGAKIAAYSLVNRSVPAGALVGGVPIKDIGKK